MLPLNRIIVAALLCIRIIDSEQKVLFVRAGDSHYFGFPGGKVDEGETIDEALYRELDEELNTSAVKVEKLIVLDGLTPDGRAMTMHLYSGDIETKFSVGAEIEEFRWLSLTEIKQRDDQMTTMTRQAMPLLQEMIG